MHIKNGIEKFKKIMSESESRKKKVAISIGIIILSIVLMITAFIISKTNSYSKKRKKSEKDLDTARRICYPDKAIFPGAGLSMKKSWKSGKK